MAKATSRLRTGLRQVHQRAGDGRGDEAGGGARLRDGVFLRDHRADARLGEFAGGDQLGDQEHDHGDDADRALARPGGDGAIAGDPGRTDRRPDHRGAGRLHEEPRARARVAAGCRRDADAKCCANISSRCVCCLPARRFPITASSSTSTTSVWAGNRFARIFHSTFRRRRPSA